MSRRAQQTRILESEIADLHKEEDALEEEINENLDIAIDTTDQNVAKYHNEIVQQIDIDVEDLQGEIEERKEELAELTGAAVEDTPAADRGDASGTTLGGTPAADRRDASGTTLGGTAEADRGDASGTTLGGTAEADRGDASGRGGSRKLVRGAGFSRGWRLRSKNGFQSVFEAPELLFFRFYREKIEKKNFEGVAVAGSPTAGSATAIWYK